MSLNQFQGKGPEVQFHQNVYIGPSNFRLCYFVYLFTQIGVSLLELLPCTAQIADRKSLVS